MTMPMTAAVPTAVPTAASVDMMLSTQVRVWDLQELWPSATASWVRRRTNGRGDGLELTQKSTEQAPEAGHVTVAETQPLKGSQLDRVR